MEAIRVMAHHGETENQAGSAPCVLRDGALRTPPQDEDVFSMPSIIYLILKSVPATAGTRLEGRVGPDAANFRSRHSSAPCLRGATIPPPPAAAPPRPHCR